MRVRSRVACQHTSKAGSLALMRGARASKRRESTWAPAARSFAMALIVSSAALASRQTREARARADSSSASKSTGGSSKSRRVIR